MAIDRETVLHTATLARLDCASLPEQELDALVDQIGRIIGYVEQLAEVDTAGVAPATHPVDVMPRLRSDTATEPLGVTRVLANAPQSRDSRFVVPRVVGQGVDDA
jgi:aspartyl-tRNA(Asn)/glutamyl-tRNA(Gln) amidotransferase subunit C